MNFQAETYLAIDVWYTFQSPMKTQKKSILINWTQTTYLIYVPQASGRPQSSVYFSSVNIFYLVLTEFSIKNAVEICKNYLSTISRSRDFNILVNKDC